MLPANRAVVPDSAIPDSHTLTATQSMSGLPYSVCPDFQYAFLLFWAIFLHTRLRRKEPRDFSLGDLSPRVSRRQQNRFVVCFVVALTSARGT
jgi:hypothetical protein